MRIAHFSDLHIQDRHLTKECMSLWYNLLSNWQIKNKADILIVAGDVFENDMIGVELFIDVLLKIFPKVIFVPGNHEYYQTSLLSPEFVFDKLMDNKQIYNCKLPYQMIEVQGYRFHCGTMWYDVTQCIGVRKGIKDFMNIRDYRYENIQKIYEQFVSELSKIEFTDKDIVVTHHAPRQKSYFNDLDPFYNGNLSSFLEEKKPKHWINGHQHTQWEYRYCNTNITTNAHGIFDAKSTEPRILIVE